MSPPVPEVRAELVAFQRAFAKKKPGRVIDGRDIGTVIVPQADVKIYVTATPEERARRRVLELQGRGEAVDEAAVLSDIIIRDERDMTRAIAPLKQAQDAHLLDTTQISSIAEALAQAIAIVERTTLSQR